MPRLPHFLDLLRRLYAAGGIALVLALSVFAASPSLHDELHAATHTDHDDSCAVVLYAHGVSLPLDAPAAPLPAVALDVRAPSVARVIFVSPPRYLHQPERGPPLV